MAWDAELRGEDTISRFGGEEFVVLLPDCPPSEAAQIVERLRAATPRGQTVSAGPRRLGLRRVGRAADRPRRQRPLSGQGERPGPPRPGALTGLGPGRMNGAEPEGPAPFQEGMSLREEAACQCLAKGST